LQRDATGVHWEATMPIGPLNGVVAYTLKQMLTPSVPTTATTPGDDAMVGLLYRVASAEAQFRNDKDRYASLEELVAEGLVSKAELDDPSSLGYQLSLSPLGTGEGSRFELLATPVSYGKPSKISFYVDETFVIRGADKSGTPASAADAPFSYGGDASPSEDPSEGGVEDGTYLGEPETAPDGDGPDDADLPVPETVDDAPHR
jgi:hypothetical protein